jgi:hypothetical protein
MWWEKPRKMREMSLADQDTIKMINWQCRQSDGASGHRMVIIAYPTEPLKTAFGDRIVNYWEDILREI